MKPQDLSEAMQFLDDSTLAETANALKKRPLNPRWFALAAAAACICIAVLLFVPTLTGQLPSAAPGSDSASGAHGDSTLQGESTSPGTGTSSPVSGESGANSPGGASTTPPTPGPGSTAPAREDLDPAYVASILNGEIPAHGEIDPSLPTITLDTDSFTSGGMGFEGYLAYDMSELENGGPWRLGDEIDTLPVYRNPWWKNEFLVVENADPDAMYARLYDVAALLGIDKAQFSDIYEYPPNVSAREAYQYKYGLTEEEVPRGFFNIYWVDAQAEGIRLSIRSDLTASIHFDPALPMPEGCNLSTDDRGGFEAAGAYLTEAYRTLMGYETPAAGLDYGDRSYDGEQHYSLRIYEASEDPVRDLENYWLDFWDFYGDSWHEGVLSGIWHRYCDRSEKLGDYPIITPAEAWQMLQNGSYITTVPVPVPEDTLPARVDLLYRNESSAQVFMPYYRFLIELPGRPIGDCAPNLKEYGTYYVPAVQSEYLDVLPVWDGSFN